jgi:uncharacterized protein (TIGR00725 family)
MIKKVFVAGNSHGKIPAIALEKAEEFGACVAKEKLILVTGGTLGVPERAVLGAKKEGGLSVAISPAKDIKEHVEKYNQSTESDIYIFTGVGDMGRNIFNTRTADAVVIIGGGMGTLNEFTMAYAEGKLIGVLVGTGGITTQIKKLITVTKKKPKNSVIYSRDPKDLLDKLIKEMK